jgi:DNA repair protein RecO (recombination protein O)
MQEIHDRGIIWNIQPFQERDALLTMITKEHGKLNILAKGIRSQKSRQSGVLQPFSCVAFSRTKPKMEKSLSRLLRSELRYKIAIHDPIVFSQLSLLSEVCRRFCAEGHSIPSVFELWEEFLQIKFQKPLNEICGFLVQFFTKLGLFPNFQKCTKSGIKFSEHHSIIWEDCSGVFCNEYGSKINSMTQKTLSFSQLKSLFFFQHTRPQYFSRLSFSVNEAQKLMNIIFLEIRSLSEKPFTAKQVFDDIVQACL